MGAAIEAQGGRSAAAWLVWLPGGEPVGPVSTELLVRGLIASKVPRHAQVSAVGTQRWVSVLTVPEIATALEAAEHQGPPVPAFPILGVVAAPPSSRGAAPLPSYADDDWDDVQTQPRLRSYRPAPPLPPPVAPARAFFAAPARPSSAPPPPPLPPPVQRSWSGVSSPPPPPPFGSGVRPMPPPPLPSAPTRA